jgi:type IV pilus assembly protein PilW
MKDLRQDQRGFTLVELMVGLLISVMVVAAGYTIMTSSVKASSVNDETNTMQQNARVAMDLLSRDIKMAGFGMNGPVGACTVGGNAAAIVPLDANAAGADNGPDSVSLVVPTLISTTTAAVGGGAGATNQLTMQAGSVAALSGDGFNGGTLPQPISIGGTLSATVNGIAGDVLTLTSTIAAPQAFPAGAQVFWLRCITYAISTVAATCAGNPPCLLRNGAPVADGIEDLQLAYGCDGCLLAVNGGVADGIVDDQAGGTANVFDQADFVSNSTWATAPMTPDKIALVRVSIVARQPRTDTGLGEKTQRAISTFAPIVVEDHNPSTDAGFNIMIYTRDRHRLFSRTVELRNVGL